MKEPLMPSKKSNKGKIKRNFKSNKFTKEQAIELLVMNEGYEREQAIRYLEQ